MLCLADLAWTGGEDVRASPRQILRRQIDRLAQRGWSANAATELEFLVFQDSYEEAWRKGYRELDHANAYNVDYSLLGTSRVEPLIRRIRNCMTDAELAVENSKGECNYGQHEINFRYADAHALCRQPRDLQERDQGDRCSGGFGDQLHGEVQRAQRATRATSTSRSPMRRARCSTATRRSSTRSLAGQLAYARELTLMLAPNINSYKRFVAGSFAPTTIAWGNDKPHAARFAWSATAPRCASRTAPAVADLNPYLALAAGDRRRAGGHRAPAGAGAGLDWQRLRRQRQAAPADPRCARPARCSPAASWPRARSARTSSPTTSTTPTSRLAAFDATVTDWERFRGFERL